MIWNDSRWRAGRAARCGLAATWALLTLNASPAAKPAPRAIDTSLIGDENAGADWPSYGRTFSENHSSPLREISSATIGRLGLAWSHDLGVKQRADSQPLEANGVVYLAVGLTIVEALDGRTGTELWRYDAHVADVAGYKLRTGWGIRGLALWEDRVIVATQDGRLIALSTTSGKPLWTVQTLDPQDETGITGAPRVFNNKVIIGFTGGDRDNVRGAVNCYDARDGHFLWRFYTVPGNPAKGFENEAMRKAASTWSGKWWQYGGGGTVWNAMTFDPQLNRVYIGTGNGSPWNWKILNPGGGDALFLSSIVALNADTGEYIWHYQTQPDEAWDNDATMDIELATLTIGGRSHRVLMQAPKNGFFYVIDRDTGKLLSAGKIDNINWADRVDIKTGRPVERPNIRYEHSPTLLWPGAYGVHNWEPMAFSPETRLAYIPTIHQADYYDDSAIDPQSWKPTPHGWNAGLGSSGTGESLGRVPVEEFKSWLLAWDPTLQKTIWRAPTPGIINGGVMATAGGLVFQGHVDGTFNAYDAKMGKKVWSFPAGVSVMGAPISYMAGGRQYITVLAGPISGSASATLPDSAGFGWRFRDSPRRALTFALDATAQLPPTPTPAAEKPLVSDSLKPEPALVKDGAGLFGIHCMTCHGASAISGGAAPDLRASAVPLSADAFKAIVQGGGLLSQGMPKFNDLSDAQLLAIRHYIRAQALPDAQPGAAPASKP
jgi:quinohemoprotein ethanol dehydrogenase